MFRISKMGALDYRDKISSLVEQRPVQPTEVAKELSTNSMLASAMLSEMSEKGLLKVSHVKVGSSPLYYSPNHPEHLLEFVKHLHEKDRKTVAVLQDKGVLRDEDQDVLIRVSLRNCKDFARQLEVSIDGKRETFWKFFLLTDEQAAEKIKLMLQPKVEPAPEAKPAKVRKPRAKKPKVEPVSQAAAYAPSVPSVPAAQPVVAPEIKAAQEAAPTIQAPAPSAGEASLQIAASDDEFLQKLQQFFTAGNIQIIEQVAIKKKNEYDFLLKLPSPVGELHYYCKAKNKAKVGEADLSHAFVQGQLKKLPVLFLAPGVMTKPAQELLKELKGLTVKQV
jgi:hypothetical protein